LDDSLYIVKTIKITHVIQKHSKIQLFIAEKCVYFQACRYFCCVCQRHEWIQIRFKSRKCFSL